MKKILSSADIIDGYEWNRQKRPCVYIWYRGTECLYVGQSRVGMTRLFAYHHVVNVLSSVEPDDEFHILWLNKALSGKESINALNEEEQRMIRKLKPKFNTITYEQKDSSRTRSDPVPNMSKLVQAKKEVAEVLFSPLPGPSILEDPQSCSNLSTAELEELIIVYKDREKQMERLDRINKLITKHAKPTFTNWSNCNFKPTKG